VKINNKSKLNACLLDTLASSSGFSWNVSALILLLSAEFYDFIYLFLLRFALLCFDGTGKKRKKNWFQRQLIPTNRMVKKIRVRSILYLSGLFTNPSGGKISSMFYMQRKTKTVYTFSGFNYASLINWRF